MTKTVLIFLLASIACRAYNIPYSTPVHTLLLCRHGDSIWNGGQPGCKETFTGWTDVSLSEKGKKEAIFAGEQIAQYQYSVDAMFTSTLQRAQHTARQCVLQRPKNFRTVVDYRLNERHYGALQGYVKKDVEDGKYGHDPEDVEAWRRSWYTVPPLLDDNDPRRIEELKLWSKACGGAENVPRGESLELVAKNRIRPLLNEVITPMLDSIQQQKTVSKTSQGPAATTGLVVAHANSLRALIGIICEVEDDPMALTILEALRIPTGIPLVLNYQRTPEGNFQVCDIPDADECIIDFDGDFGPPEHAPSDLGHPKLPVWPLNTCTPIQDIFDNKLRIRQINNKEVGNLNSNVDCEVQEVQGGSEIAVEN